jgi:3-oxoacyl-[acyl-carrier protein] reductase
MTASDLAGRVAVITGGTSGIGLGVAARFQREGAKVVLWDVNEAGLDSALSELGVVMASRVDVSDESAVSEAARAVADMFGRADILVNSAGIVGGQYALADYPLEDWLRCLKVNLTGTFLCCKHIAPLMIVRNYGRIINISSMAARDGTARAPAYSASKAGIIGLTKSIARELASTEIRVNCIAPAAIETQLYRDLPEARREAARSRIPIGRVGRVEEVAAMIAWLSSSECSFTTGAIFDLSGGRGAA